MSLAAICAAALCGCGKSPSSTPERNQKGSEATDAIGTALKQKASSEALAAVTKEKPRGTGVVQEGFKVENVSVLKYSDGGYLMTCIAHYKWVSPVEPDVAFACKDKVVMTYDADGKQTSANAINVSKESTGSN
jgi:hypothetical protein